MALESVETPAKITSITNSFELQFWFTKRPTRYTFIETDGVRLVCRHRRGMQPELVEPISDLNLGNTLRLAIEFLGPVADGVNLLEAADGKEFITGNPLNRAERISAACLAFLPVPRLFQIAAHVVIRK